MLSKKELDKELKEALRTKNHLKLSTLRMLKSSIKNQEIELRKELNEDEIIKILRKELKKRQDSINAYKSAKRIELMNKEQEEFNIINKYLPKMMSEEDIIKIVDQVIKKGINNFGQIMKEVMNLTKGQADGQIVQKIVKNKI